MHFAGIDELSERIERKKREIARGMIRPENVMAVKESIQKESKRLESILKSKPRPSGKEKDRVAKLYRHIAEGIRESHFPRSDMMKGLVSAHAEAERMVSPHIPVDAEFDDLVDACNVKPVNHKLTRNQAAKILKICGALLGEPTNAEYYRRDKRTDTIHLDEAVA